MSRFSRRRQNSQVFMPVKELRGLAWEPHSRNVASPSLHEPRHAPINTPAPTQRTARMFTRGHIDSAEG